MGETLRRNLVPYVVAAALVYYVCRGINVAEVIEAGRGATLWIFLVASLGGFASWFIGETVLYARLFSYFHGRTKVREVLPTMAAFYFLQLVNSYVASGALLLFLHGRRGTPWVAGGCTLMFLGFVDAVLLATLSLLAMVVVPTSPIRTGLYGAAGVLGLGFLIASFWLVWGKRLRGGSWLRWVYERPSMATFRTARPSHYAGLFAIRCVIVLGTGLALHGQFVSFHVEIPLIQTLALSPFIVAIGNAPLSPGGLGTTQLVLTMAFARFALRDDLFALSIAVSAFNLLIRIPMGMGLHAPLSARPRETRVGTP